MKQKLIELPHNLAYECPWSIIEKIQEVSPPQNLVLALRWAIFAPPTLY